MANELERQHKDATIGGQEADELEDENVEFWMSTPGDEDTTVWDNMVQAFKPNLMPRRKRKQ